MSELLDNLRARHYAAIRDERMRRAHRDEIKHIEAGSRLPGRHIGDGWYTFGGTIDRSRACTRSGIEAALAAVPGVAAVAVSSPALGKVEARVTGGEYAEVLQVLRESVAAACSFTLVHICIEPTIEGRTHEQIRERFLQLQQEQRSPHGNFIPRFVWLTPAQIAWAREDWSAQLRAKVQATKERERNRITCEPNWIED